MSKQVSYYYCYCFFLPFLMTFAHLCLYSKHHTTFIIYDSVMLMSSPLYDQWFGVECDIYDMTMRQELRFFFC